MSFFITEASDEKPQLLFVSPPTQITPLIVEFFRGKNFEVVLKTPQEIIGEIPDFAEEVFERRWSKIVWFFDPSFFKLAEWPNLISYLQKTQSPLMILTSLVTPISEVSGGGESNGAKGTFSNWQELAKNQRVNLNELEKALPRALFLVGQDVIGLYSMSDPPISFLFGAENRSSIFLPSEPLYLQDVETFFTSIEKYLVLPSRSEKYLFQGKKREADELQSFVGAASGQSFGAVRIVPVTSQETLSFNKTFQAKNNIQPMFLKILQQYHPPQLSSSAIKIPPTSSPSLTRLQAKPQDKSQIYTQPQPMSLPPVFPKISVLPTSLPTKNGGLSESRKSLVVPHVLPLIENRLKKYEQRRTEILQRQKFSQYWQNSILWRRGMHQAPPGFQPNIQQKNRVPNQSFAQNLTQQQQVQQEQEIERAIHQIFGEQRVQQKVQRVQKKVQKKVKVQAKDKKRNLFFIFFSVVMGVSLGCIFLWGLFFLTQHELIRELVSNAQGLVAAGSDASQIPSSSSSPAISMPSTSQISKTNDLAQFFSFQIETYQFLFGKEKLTDSAALVSVATEMNDLDVQLTQEHQLSQQIFREVSGQQSGDVPQTLASLSQLGEDIYKKLSLFQTQLHSVSSDLFSEDQKKTLDTYATSLQEKRKAFAVEDQLKQVLPDVLGFHDKKTLLILVQNNQELRPTGGFLQAIALVTFDKGVMIDSQTFDVNAVDKSFAGQIAPPADVQKYLGSGQWYFRDMNWNPNFPDTAKQVSFFVEKSLGRKIDGVVALNLTTLTDLLKVTGPVSLTEYNEVVTDKNIAERAEFHSEMRLVQDAKSEYFSLLVSKLLGQMSALPKEKTSAILDTFYQDLKSSQMLLYVSNPDQNAILESLGWTGELGFPQCPAILSDAPCLVDTAFQVESNVGLNKANYSLERSIDQKIFLSGSEVRHQRTITLKNNATTNSWPMGEYKSYIRLYVPEAANLTQVAVNDQTLTSNAVSVQMENGKKVFGFFVDVPIQQTQTIVVTYTEAVTEAQPFSYTFFEQKQPGTTSDPLSIEISADPKFIPAVIAPQASVTNGVIRFSATKDKSIFVGVKFN